MSDWADEKAERLMLSLCACSHCKGQPDAKTVAQAFREARAEGMREAANFLRNMARVVEVDRTAESLRVDMGAWANAIERSGEEAAK